MHDAVFTWVLQRLAERGLVRGERIGIDDSTLEANVALRAIVRRENGEGSREMLVRMAKASGIETPTAEDLIRLDRARKGKRLSNAEWESPTDPDAWIAKLKDGRTHRAYKPEHAVPRLRRGGRGRDAPNGAVQTPAPGSPAATRAAPGASGRAGRPHSGVNQSVIW